MTLKALLCYIIDTLRGETCVTKPLYAKDILRTTIDLEPKIRTAEENLILLPENKTIVSVCTTTVRSYVCLLISRNHLLQHCLILDSLLVIVMENVFFSCLSLESVWNLCYKTSFPKHPSQSRQTPVLTTPDNALCLCAERIYYFYDVTKPLLQSVYTVIEIVWTL